MGFLIAGVLFLLIASFWLSYCAIGMLASPVYAPVVFYSPRIFDRILLPGWIILFAVGIIFLFLVNWIWAIVGTFVYWFVLPLFVTPIVMRWILPSWDDLSDNVKDTLKIMGYNKKNYLHGNWWKRNILYGEWITKCPKNGKKENEHLY